MSDKIINEKVKNQEQFLLQMPDRYYIQKSLQSVLNKIDALMFRLQSSFPSCASKNGKYKAIDNTERSTSFWTGMLWLAYEHTGKGKYRSLAELHVNSFTQRLERNGQDVRCHDLGFLYTLSCVASSKLTCCGLAKKTAVAAADRLVSRTHEKAGIIQAWGELNDPKQQGGMVIDLNLALLFWASEATGNAAYKNIACCHVKQAQKYIVRPDASTYDMFFLDAETGTPKYGTTCNSKFENSCRSRGQAWAIYGFIAAYRYTKNTELLTLTKKLINYFLNHLNRNLIPACDFCFQNNPKAPEDSSAAAITVCALLEIIKYLPVTDPDRELYKQAAGSITRSLIYLCADSNPEKDGILGQNSCSVPAEKSTPEFCVWGDYFYFEALTRLAKPWNMYW